MEHHIDAKNKILGRVASEIALILQGKKSASYERNRVSDDKVFVTNYEHIALTGNKREEKIYYHHTGYVGHLKELTFEEKFEKDPTWVLRQAVRKMLPKNFLNQKRLANLVFIGADGKPKGKVPKAQRTAAKLARRPKKRAPKMAVKSAPAVAEKKMMEEMPAEMPEPVEMASQMPEQMPEAAPMEMNETKSE